MLKSEPANEEEEAEKLVADLQEEKNKDQSQDQDASQRWPTRNMSQIQPANKKKDKKYLEGVPLMPETENYELEPTYYYYKVKYLIKAMGMAYFPLGLHKLKAIMQLFLKNGLE